MKTVLIMACMLFFGMQEIVMAQINPQLADELQSILDNSGSNYGLHGVESTLITPDGCIWTGISGDAGPGDPASLDRKWHFASNTKSMTACIIMQLHEEGILDIDDPISDYIDTDTILHVNGDATIKMFMNHTTDVTNTWSTNPNTPLWNVVWGDRDSVWTTDNVLNDEYMLPPTPNPQMHHRYVGLTNYLLLGYVIENATGNSLETEFQNRIFDVVGMDESYLGINGVDMEQLNGVYSGNQYRGNWAHDSYLSTRGAAGALISNTNNVARFFNALNHNELLTDESMELVRTKAAGAPIAFPGTCAGDVEQFYGLGNIIVEFTPPGTDETTSLYGHAGNGLGFTFSLHDINNDFTLVLMSNDFTAQIETFGLYLELYCHLLDSGLIENCASLTGLADWSSDCGTRNMTVKFYNPGTNNSVSDYSTSLETDGSFYLPNIPEGTFDIYTKVEGALQKSELDKEILSNSNQLAVGSLTLGDLDGDNGINIIDISLINTTFGSQIGSPNYFELADLNCDGGVNIIDVSVLNIGFGLVGDTP